MTARARRIYGIAVGAGAAAIVVTLHIATGDFGFTAIVAVVVGLIGGLGWLLLPGQISPTLRCRSCLRVGWLHDIQSTSGACPSCGACLFDYRRTTVDGSNSPVSLDRDAVEGAALLRLRAEDPVSYI